MKLLFTMLAIIGVSSCAQKYQTYHVIDKYNFEKENPVVPVTKKMLPTKKVTRSYCEGQFFFTSNAKKKTDRFLPKMVQTMCPDSRYLVNNKLTELWWTTIVYSRSCVEMEAHCSREQK